MKKCCVVADFLSEENVRNISDAASKAGFEIEFFEDVEKASGHVADAEVIYSGGDASIIKEMPALKWCHTAYAGIGAYADTGLFDSGEVLLTNSSGAYGRTISEHIIMVTLLLMRSMPKYNKVMAAHGWCQDYSVRSIAGSNIAIIGTGDIGSNTAVSFRSLGARNIIGFNRSGASPDEFDAVYKLSEFETVLADKEFAKSLDVLVLCVPGTAESEGLLSRERIAMLGEKTYIVNVGRGSTVDQEALIDALNSGRIAGAALDVVTPEPLPENHPLWTAENTIVTPHIAGDMGLQYTVDKTVEFFCENLRRYSKGEHLINQADVKKGY